MEKEFKKAREFSDEVREAVLVDVHEGKLRWKDIAKEHGLDYRDVQSIGMKERKLQEIRDKEEGHIIPMYKGMRLSDGNPSPVKTFNISDLQK
ncbi:hypothetical protein [Halobacillus sp. Cin3]|uniref:hypothetical protein n=1 Tax=Halobacillus sp. Cin3 TaxID=2928441 RepID=UPI00248E658E|nr:hypothetical protein [Halobacillus sp. Cin3]